MSDVRRMRAADATTNPVHGTPRWRPVKSLWYTLHVAVAVYAVTMMFSFTAAAVAGMLTTATLCFGHSVGLHRLLIHRSFKCPRWLEYAMVYTGVLVGMGGPRKMLYMHDIRDWSQRHPQCHPFYIHARPIYIDWWWNLHCELKLDSPPIFQPERRVTRSRVYALMDRYWMLMQLPLAVCLFAVGGWAWVAWGISFRIALSLTGHWLVGYLAHNIGQQDWHVRGAAVQGYNVVGLGLITMGEAWHNNHHAFPESARLGHHRGQNDAGWWLLCLLEKIDLVWDIQLPANLPHRPELVRVVQNHKASAGKLSGKALAAGECQPTRG